MVLSLSLAACGPASAHEDAGAHDDASAPVDAGTTHDAGLPVDAGAHDDASAPVDAGTAHDAGPLDAALPADGGATHAAELAFVATYLGGISTFRVLSSGALEPVESSVDRGAHYYGLAVAPGGRLAYAVDLNAGDIVSYDVASDGTLSHLDGPPVHVGGSPITIAVDPEGRFAYVGLTESPTVVVLAIDPVTGALDPDGGTRFTVAATPAYVAIDGAGSALFVAYALGGVGAFPLDGSGAPTQLDRAPFGATDVIGGALSISPAGDRLFNAHFSLHGFAIGGEAALTRLDGSPFPEDVGSDPSATSLVVDPGGRFLYAIDMVHGQVRPFALDATLGLRHLDGSDVDVSTPYSIAVEPEGRFAFVASDFGTVTTFAIDPVSGALDRVGAPATFDGSQPEIVIAPAPTATPVPVPLR